MQLCFSHRRCNHAVLGGLLYQLFYTTHEIIPYMRSLGTRVVDGSCDARLDARILPRSDHSVGIATNRFNRKLMKSMQSA